MGSMLLLVVGVLAIVARAAAACPGCPVVTDGKVTPELLMHHYEAVFLVRVPSAPVNGAKKSSFFLFFLSLHA